MEDTVKVLVDYKDDPSAPTGFWKLCYRSTKCIPRPLVQYSVLKIVGKSLRPLKRKVGAQQFDSYHVMFRSGRSDVGGQCHHDDLYKFSRCHPHATTCCSF
ncbi:hypothetical protein FOZ61_002576 [Perkinsus olseni]|uniref:Uncharacterized protein n=1 Tax=Perkinsus olseni TaxID=32597 RepID=A0A7J6LT50_PEROL|nr:hypothetical protein FOZ61_002576 [Perkinsus olseni]